MRPATRLPSWLVLLSLFCLTLLTRWYALSGNQLFFFYDQARDAAVVQDIYLNHDLKIQGPPASGTNETVYHGVLYYYLLAGLYWAVTSPVLVTFGLVVINSLTLFPLWFLTRDLTGSRTVAALTGLFFALSFESTHAAIWLSNPNLMPLLLSGYFYSLWRVGYRTDDRYLPWLALTLGLAHQALIFTFFLYGPLAMALYYRARSTATPMWRLFSLKILLISSLIFGLTITSMLATQFVLWQRGIFTLSALQTAGHQTVHSLIGNYGIVAGLWWKKFSLSLAPGLSWVSAILTGVVFWQWVRQHREWLWFGLSWLTAPLWLFIFHPRGAYHALMSLELLIFMAASWWFITALKTRAWRPLIAILLIICLGQQLWMLHQARQNQVFLYDVRPQVLLSTQLAVIDQTYRQAAGQPFSFSALTTPYGYNATWSYLYAWYGRSTYGYVPEWLGANQTGLAGGDLLPTTSQPLMIHFALEESTIGIDTWLQETFIRDQTALGQVTQSWDNGGLRLRLIKPTQP